MDTTLFVSYSYSASGPAGISPISGFGSLYLGIVNYPSSAVKMGLLTEIINKHVCNQEHVTEYFAKGKVTSSCVVLNFISVSGE